VDCGVGVVVCASSLLSFVEYTGGAAVLMSQSNRASIVPFSFFYFLFFSFPVLYFSYYINETHTILCGSLIKKKVCSPAFKGGVRSFTTAVFFPARTPHTTADL
jgi:hypothetical protein